MGGLCASAGEKDIDSHMKEDKRSADKLIRILLLGPGDSGKTTIVKQMKKIHHGKIEYDELLNFRDLIRKQILDIIASLCKESLQNNQNLGDELNEARNKFGDDFNIQEYDTLTDVDNIKKLWKSNDLQACRKSVLLPEHADYFMNRIDEIDKEDYVPIFEDYVRCRVKTTGNTSEKFNTKTNDRIVPVEIIDVGGQRSERKKWMHLFSEEMDSVLYIFGLGGYDKVLYEDANQNRLQEAFDLFEEVKKKGFLEQKTVVLFFNKYDLFEVKIKSIPITKALKDYPDNLDPCDENEVVGFLLEKFQNIYKREYKHDKRQGTYEIIDNGQDKQINTRTFFMHRTTAIDTDLIEKIMSSIQTAIVMNNLDNTF